MYRRNEEIFGYGVIIMRSFLHTQHAKSKRKIMLSQFNTEISVL